MQPRTIRPSSPGEPQRRRASTTLTELAAQLGANFRAEVLAATLSLGLGACSDPPPSPDPVDAGHDAGAPSFFDADRIEVLQEVVQATLQELGAPGAVVRIVRGRDAWSQAFGVSHLATDTPLGTTDLWPLRSITKSFTVTLVLQLVDEGRVGLDDPLGDHLPGLTSDAPFWSSSMVTLRQLADMTSGLPDYTNPAWVRDFLEDPTRWFSLDELIGYPAEDAMQFQPGTRRVYTNLNTLLLGRLVEVVTGTSFEEALATRILEPLGLDRTQYPSAPSDVEPSLPGYEPDPDADGGLAQAPVNFSVFGPAGAMLASVEDLSVWGPALARGTLIEAATQQARLQGGPLDQGPEYDEYALGIGRIEGWWGHTGEGFGFTALVMHEEASDTTVAIVVNAAQLASHLPTTLFRRIVPALR